MVSLWSRCIAHSLLCSPIHSGSKEERVNGSYLARITDTTHHWGMWKIAGLTNWGGRKEKTATHNHMQPHHHVARCGDALITCCFDPWIPSSEENKTHQSLAMISDTAHSGTHRLRWEEGENFNTLQLWPHHNISTRCGNALLTNCYIPCFPSGVEKSKPWRKLVKIINSAHINGACRKSRTHQLR